MVQFSNTCENLSYNYSENLIIIVVFQKKKLYVGASTPTTMKVVSPLVDPLGLHGIASGSGY
jgi:hypothetical protein